MKDNFPCGCVDAAGPSRDISLLRQRPDKRGGFSGSKSADDAVTWRPFYCILHPEAGSLLCLHSVDQV